ncbi:holin [Helicobacter pylori]
MQQDLIVLGFEVSKLIPYFLVGMIGLFVGFLYVLRSFRTEKFENKYKYERVIYIIQGIGSSMLITWIGFEIMDYFFNLPTSLCIAISGGLGYLGAESVSDLVLDSLKKRL